MIILIRTVVFVLLIASFYLVCYITKQEPHELAALFALGYVLTDMVYGITK